MNISNKNIEKLKEKKKEFYEEIILEVKDLIQEDGEIYVKLDKIEKDYDYFFNLKQYILIKKEKNDITITDNFDKDGILIENDNNFNLLQCIKKIHREIILEIERYNKMNIKIESVI